MIFAPAPALEDSEGFAAGAPVREKAARALLAALIALIAYPVRSYPLTGGLDPSWAFALNYAHAKGFIFGRDLNFTYGPLAWLALPMDVGNNLRQGIAFQIVCWLAFTGAICWFVFARRIGLWHAAAFAACLLAGWRSFHHYDYVGLENFIAFLALLLLGGALIERRWYFCFGASCLLGVMLFFVKFSAGMLVAGAALLFSAGMWPVDRRKALCSGFAAAFVSPLVFAGGYLLYHPSLPDLRRYARAGFEISAGYSAAMSAEGSLAPLVMALVLLVSWLLLTAVLYRSGDRAFPLAIGFLAPWFVLFKHSFVREAFHAGTIFAFAPLLWALVLLFSELGRKDLPRLAPAGSLFVAVMGLSLAPVTSPTRVSVAMDRLPLPITAAIGSEPVAIFPHELTYAAANGLNFRPFPVLQAYSAYTPYLDAADAAFLNNDATAPRLVLFDWQAIDGRNPFLDVPGTALALYRQYDLQTAAAGHLVLRRRAVPRFGAPRLVETREWRRSRALSIPASRHPLIGRIYLERTWEGSVRNLLFRLPAIRLITFRVPPAVLEDGVPLNFLPWNLEEARGLFSGSALPVHPGELTLGGPGTRYFRDPVKIDLMEIPEVTGPERRSGADATKNQ